MMFGVPRAHKSDRIAMTGMGVVTSLGAGKSDKAAYPRLLAVGLGPTAALATNKVQSSFGAASATMNYTRGGAVRPENRVCARSMAPQK